MTDETLRLPSEERQPWIEVPGHAPAFWGAPCPVCETRWPCAVEGEARERILFGRVPETHACAECGERHPTGRLITSEAKYQEFLASMGPRLERGPAPRG